MITEHKNIPLDCCSVESKRSSNVPQNERPTEVPLKNVHPTKSGSSTVAVATAATSRVPLHFDIRTTRSRSKLNEQRVEVTSLPFGDNGTTTANSTTQGTTSDDSQKKNTPTSFSFGSNGSEPAKVSIEVAQSPQIQKERTSVFFSPSQTPTSPQFHIGRSSFSPRNSGVKIHRPSSFSIGTDSCSLKKVESTEKVVANLNFNSTIPNNNKAIVQSATSIPIPTIDPPVTVIEAPKKPTEGPTPKKRFAGTDISNCSSVPSTMQALISQTKSLNISKNDCTKAMGNFTEYVPVFGRTAVGRPTFTMNFNFVNVESTLKWVCQKLVKVSGTEVTVQCEGTLSKLSLILVGTKEELFIFDCVALDAQKVCEGLKPLLYHEGILKLIHDSHNTAALLKKFGDINEIYSVFDTQLLIEVITSKWDIDFKEMLDECGVQNTYNAKRALLQQSKLNLMEQRPLNMNLKKFFLDDARQLHEAYGYQLEKMLNKQSFAQILNASFARVRYAASTGGERNICFSTRNEYRMQSFECMQEVAPSFMLKPAPTVVSNDSAPLIELLPEDLATWVRGKADNLFEIVLDKGRPPTAWIGQERVMIGGNNTNRLVTDHDISYVTTKLGKFGSDNRAGLERQLHRISAMRNRSQDIIGLTMRVGRHVSGNAYIITDLLYRYPNSSILFVGEPGSGKTTVVREVTRLLADFNNVCIVDTSNEIAGDGDVPHPCVGHARRMMVPKLDMQSDIMVECVQNHTPEIIVIDEIGRSNEVEAARTCKNRGVRLIASAHGDLRQLVKNPKLRGLVGGVERVTIGDEEAKKLAKQLQVKQMQKTKSERGGPPTFDIIVELKRGAHHEWTIIFDVGAAVDKILEGQKYPIQRRTRNPKTGAINLVLDEA